MKKSHQPPKSPWFKVLYLAMFLSMCGQNSTRITQSKNSVGYMMVISQLTSLPRFASQLLTMIAGLSSSACCIVNEMVATRRMDELRIDPL